MADFGYPELLSLAQTIGIVGTMVLTLYFSRRQIQNLSRDTETRVLNDLDEKMHRLGELFVEKPDMIKVIADESSGSTPEHVVSYYVLYICSHAFDMRERKLLSDNEWDGWLHWMQNSFRQGRIGKHWKEMQIASWFDPRFQNFINKEIVPSIKA